jgi:hypothetical protein
MVTRTRAYGIGGTPLEGDLAVPQRSRLLRPILKRRLALSK